MRARLGVRTLVAMVVIGASIVLVAPAATALTCGEVVTASIKLRDDLGPCDSGLVAGQDAITIDLGGHRIFGTNAPGGGDVGVRLTNRTGVKIKNGEVTGFDVGIKVEGGGTNTVNKVSAFLNIGSDSSGFGDGIVIRGSSNNVISENKTFANGPFSGISVISTLDNGQVQVPSLANQITGNVVRDNSFEINSNEMNDIGIRLEQGVSQNVVRKNDISFNGLHGIELFEGANGNVVSDNFLKGNGFHPKAHAKGDGIRIEGNNNRSERNQSNGNAANGLILSPAASGNVLQQNQAKNNAAADLLELDGDCGDNTWMGNRGVAALPPCTKA